MRIEIAFPSRVVKRGNGMFIPVPKSYIDSMGLSIGSEIDVVVRRPKTDDEE